MWSGHVCRQGMNALGCVSRHRFAVADGDCLGAVTGHASKRGSMLGQVQVERGPAGAKGRPGGEGISGEERAALRSEEGQMPRRVAGRVQNLERTDLVALTYLVVNGAGRVGADAQVQAQLKRIGGPPDAQRACGDVGDRLRLALTRDDIAFPLVRIDGRTAQALERSQSAQMRAMRVRQDNVLEVADVAADLLNGVHDDLAVCVEKRINKREVLAVVEQKGMDMTPLALPQAVYSGRDFHKNQGKGLLPSGDRGMPSCLPKALHHPACSFCFR